MTYAFKATPDAILHARVSHRRRQWGDRAIDARTARFLYWLAEDFVAMVECDKGQRNSGGDVIEALGEGFRQALRQAKGRGIA